MLRVLLLLFFAWPGVLLAQNSPTEFVEPGTDPQNSIGPAFVKHLAQDQRSFWSAPSRLRRRDAKWLIPFAATTAAFISADSWLSKQVPPKAVNESRKLSGLATYSLIGVGATSYLAGLARSDDRLREAGLLSGEAAINSLAVATLLQHSLQRQRPLQQGASFFSGGNSFPSRHSAVAWSIASVWAHEYPGTMSQALAYGLASAASATRVTSRQHFASDAIIGSALGWYFGRNVYRAHHDSTLGGAPWGSPFDDTVREHTSDPRNLGSPDVPIDSWIYSALDRLIARGYVKSAHTGIRPWPRIECARMVEEANESTRNDSDMDDPLSALRNEFAREIRRLEGAPNLGAQIDAVYFRSTAISGPVLHDGYHFGQSIVNDYGRPYGEGFNSVAGFVADTEAGPLAIFAQGELQHAPAVMSEPVAAMVAAAQVDWTEPVSTAVPRLNRFRLLQGTVSLTHRNLRISFGQQNLWLGSGESGPLLCSNNAEPLTMLRFSSVSPYRTPLVSRFLGPMQSEFFLARLSGHQFEGNFGPGLTSQPYLHGTKLSFRPTDNLEISAGFTAQFGGEGNPFTWANFLRTFYSHKVGWWRNPGKRLSEFEFRYRVPGLRDRVEVYVDSMVIDEYSPVGSNRPAINPGVYFSRFPWIEKMDLRLEGVTTDLNVPAHYGPGAFYWDDRYHSGYTNNGNLIGSWIGRRGRAEQAWVTYHLSARNYIQLGLRHNNVDKALVEGGALRDVNVRVDWMLTRTLGISVLVQQESWKFPILAATPQSNVMGSFQLTYWPVKK